MMNNPIVDEVRRAREELMEKHGSLEALAREMRQREAATGNKVVSYEDLKSASEPMILKEEK